MIPGTPTGTGDSLQERVDDFIDKYNDWVSFGGDGIVLAESSHVTRQNVFLYDIVHRLSLTELREFPMYLCDVSTRCKNVVISAEHYSFWSWTLAFVQYVRRDSDTFTKFSNPYHPKPAPSPGSANLMNDMFLMHRLLCLPLRMTAPTNNMHTDAYIKNALKLTNRMSEMDTVRLFAPLSLALLDGLVCRHCSTLLTPNGNLHDPPIRSPWSSDHSSKSGVGYHDRLQIWRYNIANQTTKDTLTQIDDMERYKVEYLERLSSILDTNQDLEDINHFLQLLSNQRHYAVHGEGSSVSILPIALSLCCLIFWDSVNQDIFDRYHEEVVNEVRAATPNSQRQSEYTDFYPIFSWQFVSLMELYPTG